MKAAVGGDATWRVVSCEPLSQPWDREVPRSQGCAHRGADGPGVGRQADRGVRPASPRGHLYCIGQLAGNPSCSASSS
jgi:hypothetical protein